MAWFSRMRALFGKEKLAREVEEELEFHLSMREQWHVEQGIPKGEARREARLRFGNPSVWRERVSEIDLMPLPQTVLQDLRFGARMLCCNIGFTVVAVLALALGIGVNTAAFTAYKAFFDRHLDAHDPKRMVNIALIPRSGAIEAFFSYPDYEAYRDQLHSFSGVIAHATNIQFLPISGVGDTLSQSDVTAGSIAGKLGLLPTGASNKEFAETMIVSEDYFSVLGVAPMRGRSFDAMSPTELAAAPSVLISENYWQKRFGGDPALLGKTLRLNGVAFTIIGITPRDFTGTTVLVPDFWVPLMLKPLLHADDHSQRDRETPCCRLFGRLAPGVRIDQAQAEVNLLANRLSALHDPHTDWGKPATALVWPGSPFPIPLNSKAYAPLTYAVFLILLAVGMVLLIACANVGSLQLARATSRQSELCMRLSLGASRLRIVRQLLTESALLGLLAGSVGLMSSWLLTKGAATMAAKAFPAEYGTMIFRVTPDLGTFVYVFVLSTIASLVFGLAPALESSRSALAAALKGNQGTSSGRSRRLRDFFIAAQVAVALALMIADSMLIHSSIRALKVDPGCEIKHDVDLNLNFPEGAQYTAERKNALVDELRTRLAALPGVAAITNADAPVTPGRRVAVSLNGELPSTQNTRATLSYTYVQENYFDMFGIPILSGHNFQSQSERSGATVILSESAAQQLWPGQDPIGQGLRLGTDGQYHSKNELLPDGPVYQVIGVTRDTHPASLDGSASELIYLPMPEDRLQDFPILIRTQSDPKQLFAAINPVVESIDPGLIASSLTLEELLHRSPVIFLRNLVAAIATPVGLIGLLLASMGIYGTASYIVVLRTREVGIRMALGAKKRDVLALMLREVARPVLAGLVVGMIFAVGASYLLRGVLHGVSTVDSVSFAGISLLFLAIALIAAWLPSRRAMRVDPMVALRCE
jgi:predicted permease